MCVCGQQRPGRLLSPPFLVSLILFGLDLTVLQNAILNGPTVAPIGDATPLFRTTQTGAVNIDMGVKRLAAVRQTDSGGNISEGLLLP